VPTPQKVETVKETADMLREAEAVVLADYRQLSVAQMNDMRRDLAQNGVQVRVIKNTLIRRAADEVGILGLDAYLIGPTIVMASKNDPVAPAKNVQRKARELRTLEVKAGLLQGRVLSANEVRDLANLPGQQELRAQVVGTLVQPLRMLVTVLEAPVAGLARALEQVRLQRAAEEPA
jgi:large subunit ribosomal protein L10